MIKKPNNAGAELKLQASAAALTWLIEKTRRLAVLPTLPIYTVKKTSVKPLKMCFLVDEIRTKEPQFGSSRIFLTVWNNEKFTITEKKFRQINYLVISLVKPLLSRNFCQKYVRVIFRNFYTAVLKYMISCCFHEIFFRCMK